jgi:hypothetical protein
MLALGFGGNGRLDPSEAGGVCANAKCGVDKHRPVAITQIGNFPNGSIVPSEPARADMTIDAHQADNRDGRSETLMVSSTEGNSQSYGFAFPNRANDWIKVRFGSNTDDRIVLLRALRTVM